MENQKEEVSRTIYGFFELLGDIGGVQAVLWIFAGSFVSIFANKIYMASVIQKMYHVKRYPNIEKQKKEEAAKVEPKVVTTSPGSPKSEPDSIAEFSESQKLKKLSFREKLQKLCCCCKPKKKDVGRQTLTKQMSAFWHTVETKRFQVLDQALKANQKLTVEQLKMLMSSIVARDRM